MRAILLIALVACSSSNGEKEALKLANDLANDAVARIAVSLKSDRPVDGMFDCAITSMNETLTKAGGTYAELATKLQRLCDHDVPLATIKHSVEKAEAAHAKDPKDTMLTECVVNDIPLALPALKNRDEAKELLARYVIVCPNEKLRAQ